MNYEQKYNEALERAKKIHDSPNASNGRKEWLESIFPELAESEDERIRKSLLAYIKGESKRLDTKNWIAYLEKQKEQKPGDDEWLKKYNDKVNEEIGSSSYNAKDCAKPAEWRPFDKEILTKIKELIDSHFSEHEQREVYKDWLDEHISQPAKWGEEDETALEYLHELIGFGYSKKLMDAQTAHDMRKWVNEHLRPDSYKNCNSRWKPSEKKVKPPKNVPPIESIMK